MSKLCAGSLKEVVTEVSKEVNGMEVELRERSRTKGLNADRHSLSASNTFNWVILSNGEPWSRVYLS